MAGLSSNIQIYPNKGKPLLFRSAIGSLGKISIYIKSKDFPSILRYLCFAHRNFIS